MRCTSCKNANRAVFLRTEPCSVCGGSGYVYPLALRDSSTLVPVPEQKVPVQSELEQGRFVPA